MSDTRHGRRWGEDIDPNLAGPMARASDGKDYYVQEFAMADVPALGGLVPVMIARWYEKDCELTAKVHPVGLTPSGDAFIVDGRDNKVVEVPLGAFLLSTEEMLTPEVQAMYKIPSPERVFGMFILPKINNVRCHLIFIMATPPIPQASYVPKPSQSQQTRSLIRGHSLCGMHGGCEQMADGCMLCLYGCIATIHQATRPKNGTNIIPYSSSLRGCLTGSLKSSTISTSSRRRT